MNRFHCCATCQHYAVNKVAGRSISKCARLGFDTNPKYQFDCWNPKPNVKKLMEKEKGFSPE
ncbi:hypothetical protein CIG75_06635 [Tumebacillus algifaecis]|uniref:Uncharacterized protein n=1 Tax=Tumebacillus algifaecis TaxID=1214604 RepID=A0A223CZ23_9BACL|nr:hypothetical protein [Tumebacillus algifaecis]ASS74679.1 hypothetical protein CIG75_06635 [Tumebacillus algifaecis]